MAEPTPQLDIGEDEDTLHGTDAFSPTSETALSVADWWQLETMTFEYNRYKNGGVDMLPYYLAQGWVLVDATTRTEQVNPLMALIINVYTLKRNRFKAKDALQELMTRTVAAYNEGRTVNHERYDDLVTLYSQWLSQTETQLEEFTGTGTYDIGETFTETTYDGLARAVLAMMFSDSTTHATTVDALIDTGFSAARLADINTRFDAELATAHQSLLDRGMLNATVDASVIAGIEVQRAKAINDLEDKVTQQKLASADSLYAKKQAVLTAILETLKDADKIKDQLTKDKIDARSKVILETLGFMERRDDGYPSMAEVHKLAESFGTDNALPAEAFPDAT